MDLNNEDRRKKCPICGYECVHPVAVYVRTEEGGRPMIHAITEAGHTVTPVVVDEVFDNIRGVVIIREYLGECEHRWLERERFHKGETYTDVKPLGLAPGPGGTIWRN